MSDMFSDEFSWMETLEEEETLLESNDFKEIDPTEDPTDPRETQRDTFIFDLEHFLDQPVIRALAADLRQTMALEGQLDAHLHQLLSDILANLRVWSTEIILRPTSYLYAAFNKIPAKDRPQWLADLEEITKEMRREL